MAKKNVASSGFTAVQAGNVVPPSKDAGTKPAKPAKAPKKGSGGATNIATGNARVGVQTDEVRGGLTIRMGGGR
jgi:hypothetical protein